MKRYYTKLENRKDADTFLATLEATSCVLWSSGKKPTQTQTEVGWDNCPLYLFVGDSLKWSVAIIDAEDAEELDNIDFLRHCARSFPIVNIVYDQVSLGEKVGSCYVLLGDKRKSLLEDIRRYSSVCFNYYEDVCNNDCLMLDSSHDGPYLADRSIEDIDTGSILRVSHAEFLARCIQLSPKKDDEEYNLRTREEILDMLEMAEDVLGQSSNDFINAYRSGGHSMLLWVCGLLDDPAMG